MSYLSMWEMNDSAALRQRALMCVIQEGVPQDDGAEWVREHILELVTAPGWDAAWDSAKVSPEAAQGDLGRAEDVITDLMILAQVQKLMGRSSGADRA